MTQLIKSSLSVLLAVVFAATAAFAQADDKAQRSGELLAKARIAIGGEEKIKAIKSLALAAKFHRTAPLGELRGEMEYEFLFPDKLIKRQKMETAVGVAAMIWSLDGEIASFDTVSPNEKIRFEIPSQKELDAERPTLRAEAARILFGMLLDAPGNSSLKYAYAGEGVANGSPANMVDVKDANGFEVRLFLDKATNRLAMMSYIGKLAGVRRREMRQNEDGSVSQVDKESKGSFAGMREDEVRITFADYRVSAEGVQLPHRFVFQSGEGVKEEWTFTKVQVNAPLAPESFKKKA